MTTDEYKGFYENGPAKVDILLSITTKSKIKQEPVQLEGIIIGETESNLIFESIKSINLGSIIKIDGGYSMVRKSSISSISKKAD